jgi:two-component system response regulator MprA
VAHRILIANDDRNLRAVLGDLLTDAGYEVETVSNGLEALAAVERTPPALLLLDLRVPNLDGFGVLEHLRDTGRTFPVIMITAQYDAGEAALTRGALRVLVKPLTLDVLLDAVEETVT